MRRIVCYKLKLRDYKQISIYWTSILQDLNPWVLKEYKKSSWVRTWERCWMWINLQPWKDWRKMLRWQKWLLPQVPAPMQWKKDGDEIVDVNPKFGSINVGYFTIFFQIMYFKYVLFVGLYCKVLRWYKLRFTVCRKCSSEKGIFGRVWAQ